MVIKGLWLKSSDEGFEIESDSEEIYLKAVLKMILFILKVIRQTYHSALSSKEGSSETLVKRAFPPIIF